MKKSREYGMVSTIKNILKEETLVCGDEVSSTGQSKAYSSKSLKYLQTHCFLYVITLLELNTKDSWVYVIMQINVFETVKISCFYLYNPILIIGIFLPF